MLESDNKFIPPRSLDINDYTYSFKDELKNNFYSYRYKYRSICGITIKIEENELKNYLLNKGEEIKYEITSGVIEHKCKDKVIKEQQNKREDIN